LMWNISSKAGSWTPQSTTAFDFTGKLKRLFWSSTEASQMFQSRAIWNLLS
jgi:hypothetical protein